MSEVTIRESRYGKRSVRLAQVLRSPEGWHDVVEATVNILFSGDFDTSFREGDNRNVLPTDTMKNSVYVLARQHPIQTIEKFARVLADHFLQRVPEVKEVEIEIEQKLWDRIAGSTTDFVQSGAERRIAKLMAGRERQVLSSGFRDLEILKTSNSAFDRYRKDSWTTLPETRDRLLGTNCEAEWRWRAEPSDYDEAYREVRESLLDTFSKHASESVQHTMYAMAEQALQRFSNLASMRLVMPNRHRLSFDLDRFGVDNPNQVFVATTEPYGYIEATLERSGD